MSYILTHGWSIICLRISVGYIGYNIRGCLILCLFNATCDDNLEVPSDKFPFWLTTFQFWRCPEARITLTTFDDLYFGVLELQQKFIMINIRSLMMNLDVWQIIILCDD